MDVSTLQGETLGRVNMSKIKPYHEPLEAKAYVLEVNDATNSPLDKTSTNCSNGSNHINHRNGESSYLRKLCTFYEGQKVVTKYLSNKQVGIPFHKQKWVGPYTITRIYDDETIEINIIHQKRLGRWRSKKFLPYDWVNPNQVITFDQGGMEVFTFPDYNEVHHKLLECYSAQPLAARTHGDSIQKVKAKMIMEFYPSKDEGRKLYAYNNIKTPQVYTIPQQHYDVKTCAKDVTSHPHHKVVATRSLNQACKTKVHLWSIIYALFMIREFYYNDNLTPEWEPSIHSYIQEDTIQFQATQITENFNGTKIVLSKHHNTTIPNIQYNIPQVPKVPQLYIGGVTTQKEAIKLERSKGTTPCRHKSKKITTPSPLTNYGTKIPSWNGQLTLRKVTELPESIITKTLTTEFPGLLLDGFPSLTSFSQSLIGKSENGLFALKHFLALTLIHAISYIELGQVNRSQSSVYCNNRRQNSFSVVEPDYLAKRLDRSISLLVIRLRIVTMGLTTKEKGKAAMTRSAADISFSTDMAALDYEPNREEETFLQFIGLDRFITRFTWEIINANVIQEVITNLDVKTMETKLNGRTIPIFGKAWRQTMNGVFYLNTFMAKREPGMPRVHATDLFPNIKEKMKSKIGTCKINDCTIIEARKPLKFFNSLFLLRTSANTITGTTIVHIQDALNGKEVDCPALFHGYIKTELINLKEALYKDKTTSLRTLVGPPLTMLLIHDGFLTVEQELDARVLNPSETVEKHCEKKRKLETQPTHQKGESSKIKEGPQVLSAMAEPVQINTCESSQLLIKTTELVQILGDYNQASQKLRKWIYQSTSVKAIITEPQQPETNLQTPGKSPTITGNQ